MRSAYPEELKNKFLQLGFWKNVTIMDYYNHIFKTYSDEIALIDDKSTLTYGQLEKKSKSIAFGFANEGIFQGDVVILQMENSADFIAVLLALIGIGALPVLALPTHGFREITALIGKTSAVAYVCTGSDNKSHYQDIINRSRDGNKCMRLAFSSGKVEGCRNIDDFPLIDFEPQLDIDASKVAFFLLSGGTTNIPKLIPRTHNDYIYNFELMAKTSGFTNRTKYLAALPAAHNFTLGCPGVLGCLANGGVTIFAPKPDIIHICNLIERHKITNTALVPVMADLLLQANELGLFNLDSLAVVQVGGATFSPSSAARILDEVGCNLQQVFGMSEGLLCATNLEDSREIKIFTQGRPISEADEIKIVNSSGSEVEVEVLGELLTRGPYTIREYFNEPYQNQKLFDKDGFYCSGDLVRKRADGNIVVMGRSKDQINRGGEKYSPKDVEDCLLQFPEIESCAVVAIPDAVLGEKVFLFVISPLLHEQAKKIIEKLDLCELPRYKYPDKIVFIERMPTTSVGKVDKQSLVEMLTK